MLDFESAAMLAEQAQSEIDRLANVNAKLIMLLREAQDMWAFSRANEMRGVYDVEWNKKREALLRELGEPVTAPWNTESDKQF